MRSCRNQAERADGQTIPLPFSDQPARPGPATVDRSSFLDRAKLFVIGYLEEHGRTGSEDLTDKCKAAGIAPKGDDRAFGSVYASLSLAGEIRKAAAVHRRKGHGTAGGIVWDLTRRC